MPHHSAYACNLPGVARLALDRWKEAKAAYPSGEESEDLILTGRCQAYGAILAHITGRPSGDTLGWDVAIDAMSRLG